MPIVFVVDDDEDVRRSLERLLASAGLQVASFGSPQSFLVQYDPKTEGCLVLDLSMPEIDGLELQRQLQERGGDLPIVFLSGHADVSSSVRAMKRGATDFLTKPVDDDDLLRSVHEALKHARAARQSSDERITIERRLARLTARERQVFDGIVAGRLNKQIAADLGTVEKTVKFHRANLMRKLAVRTVADLVKLAERARFGAPS
jgi:FixJ family two-component response regulator